MFDRLFSALRFAGRSLRRSPGFAAAAVLTLALGIGVTTAAFSVVSTALLRPLDYPNADRLVAFQETHDADRISVSYLDLQDFAQRSHALTRVAGFYGHTFTITGDDDAARLRGTVVTSNLFSTLGITPLMGRAFVPEDDAEGAARVVAISYGLWRQRFGGDSAIVGRTITLDGEAHVIVAVMRQGFRFPDGIVYGPADVWAPMSMLGAADRRTRDSHPGIEGVGLLQPGATLQSARLDLASVAAQLRSEYPRSNQDTGVRVDDAVTVIVGSLGTSLRLVFGAVMLVLLIALANVAGLVLTRADVRRRELAVRAALGASPAQMAQALIGEGLLLAAAGGMLGAVAAEVFVVAARPALADLPRLGALSVDGPALALALGVAAIVAVALTALPVAWARRGDIDRWLRSRGVAGTARPRVRHALVIGEIALSLVLLVSATLLLRTFEHMRADRGGIDPDGVLTFAIRLPAASYPTPERRAGLYRRLEAQLSVLPGVTAVGAVTPLPFSGSGRQSGMRPAGTTEDASTTTDIQIVTPGYFRAMGVTLVRGRVFTAADGPSSPHVVVIDERLAQAFWPGEDPLGKRIIGMGDSTRRVIGVVRHVASYGVAAESRQELYVAEAQDPFAGLTLAVKTAGDPASLAPSVRRIVAGLDANLPVYSLRTMHDVVDRTVSGPRLAAILTGAYAAIALLLGVVGVYGVIAYLVAQRTREIGVRIALGAQGSNVFRYVVTRALRLAVIGVIVGAGGAVAAARLLRGSLYGVTATQPTTFLQAAIVLIAAAALAAALPAWRATRISPLAALSDD